MKQPLLVAWIIGTAMLTGAFASDEMKFGKELILDTSIEISTILQSPDAYVGKKVRIEGRVVGVCEKQGCWMEIVGEKPTAKIKAKVEDGVMVFPPQAIGKTAVVEGELQEFNLTLEQTIAYLKHEAEERGETLEPGSVKEPKTLYQIKVHGALVR